MKKYCYVTYQDERPPAIVLIDRHRKDLFNKEVGVSSISPGYDTEEELRKNYPIADWSCSKCGGVVSLSFYHREELEKNKMCFSCHCWHSRIKLKSNQVIIDGALYSIGRENMRRAHSGFGGRRFRIKRFESDEIIETTNLWFGGDVPDRFHNDFPDNAEFVKI
jgi:hypothetical protein